MRVSSTFVVVLGPLVALGARGCLGRQYVVIFFEATHGIVSTFVFCSLGLGGGVCCFVLGTHTSFVP